jgi:hypothetical protein
MYWKKIVEWSQIIKMIRLRKIICWSDGIIIRVEGNFFSNFQVRCNVFISMMDFLVLLFIWCLVLWDVLMVCCRCSLSNSVPQTVLLEIFFLNKANLWKRNKHKKYLEDTNHCSKRSRQKKTAKQQNKAKNRG